MLSFDILLFNTKIQKSKIPRFKATDFVKIQKKIPCGPIPELFEKKRQTGPQSSIPKWSSASAIPPSSTDAVT